jgi:hypothetical protein
LRKELLPLTPSVIHFQGGAAGANKRMEEAGIREQNIVLFAVIGAIMGGWRRK